MILIAAFFIVLDHTGGPQGIVSQLRYASWIREYRGSRDTYSDVASSDYGDYVGFLTVDGTSVEYPVMRDRNDPDGGYYYLTHNFEGEYDPSGCPFIRYTADVDDDIVEVFAHNNRNGTMFADLARFEDEDFFREYGDIIFDTAYGKRSYRVIAVLDVNAGSEEYPYFGWQNFPDEESEVEFLERIYALSGVTDNDMHLPGSSYLLLVTCEYSHVNGRRIVVAVRTS